MCFLLHPASIIIALSVRTVCVLLPAAFSVGIMLTTVTHMITVFVHGTIKRTFVVFAGVSVYGSEKLKRRLELVQARPNS